MAARPESARSMMEEDPDMPYPMVAPRLGHAIIVCNVVTEFPGSAQDVAVLQAAYEKTGFDVQVHTDCTVKKMREIERFLTDPANHKDSNCVLVTVICHGNERGQLFDKDGKKSWDTELLVGHLSDVETLEGKPKILVIQACRGAQIAQAPQAKREYLVEDDTSVETPNILPDKADMYLAYATVPGYKAHAGNEAGSIYLQTLARYLEKGFMKRPLNKILQMVRQHMVKNIKGNQCPEERNTLLYDVMFSEFHRKGSKKQPVSSSNDVEKVRKELEEKFKMEQEKMKEEIRQLKEKKGGADGVRPKPEKKEEVAEVRPKSAKSVSKATVATDKSEKLEIRVASTVDLPMFDIEQLTMMTSSGRIVVIGSLTDKSGPALHIFSLEGKKPDKTIKLRCDHSFLLLLPIMHQGQEVVLTSCHSCKRIDMVVLATGKVREAFSGTGFNPHRTCGGSEGRVYTMGLDEEKAKPGLFVYKVLELDTTCQPFTVTRQFDVAMAATKLLIPLLAYMPNCHTLAIADKHSKQVCAFSCEDGSKVWEVAGKVDGKDIDPRKMLYAPGHEVLIVFAYRRFVLLDPSTGTFRQTIPIPQEIGSGEVGGIVWYQDQVVLRYCRRRGDYKVLFLSVC